MSIMQSKSLFDVADNDAIVARIQGLQPDAAARWGKMNVAQMLAHCQAALRVATGELKLRRGLIGVLFGGLAKKKLLGADDFKPNLPTDKSFLVRDARDFAREREKLVVLLRDFEQNGREGLTREPHPFFGPLSASEWDRLQWKHLDHHLRQFGA